MKIVGIALVWVGALFLLQNLGIIAPVTWNVIWPVFIIIAGLSMKHFNHSIICAVGGKCGPCGKGGDHKCEGEDCGTCRK